MGGRGKIGFIIPLVLLFAILFISSFFIPFAERKDEWIPLLSGFVNTDYFFSNQLLLLGVGLISIIGLIFSIYFINSKVSNTVDFRQDYGILGAVFMILANPMSLYFSSVYQAAILLTWMQYCIIEKQRFTAFFLLSLSALFFAPLFWAIPFALLITLIGLPDLIRNFIKCISGAVLPFIYLLFLRWILFNDTDVFIQLYFSKITSVELAFYNINFSTLFMFICFGVILLHAVIQILYKMSRQSIITGYILRLELAVLLMGVVIFCAFYNNGVLPVSLLLVTPISLILSNFFVQNKGNKSADAELILLLSSVAIARAAYFI